MRNAIVTLFMPTTDTFHERPRNVYEKYHKKIKNIHKKYASSIDCDYVCYDERLVNEFWNKHPKYKDRLKPWMKILLSKFYTLEKTLQLYDYDNVAFIDFDVIPTGNNVNLFKTTSEFVVDMDDLNNPFVPSLVEVFKNIKQKTQSIGITHTNMPDGGVYMMNNAYIKTLNIYKYFDDYLDIIFDTYDNMEEWLCSEEMYLMYFMQKESILHIPFGQMNDIRYDKASYIEEIEKGGLCHFYNKQELEKYLENV